MKTKINIELIAKCLEKDTKAQRELYGILLPYLNLICRRYLRNTSDIQDVLQDVFIKIFKNLEQFDINKASFKTWSTRIAINTCLDSNAKYARKFTDELIVDLHDSFTGSDIIENMSVEALLTWLKKMPFQYFEVFNMFIIDGFSHEEIAQALGITQSASRKRLSRARIWIKKRWGDKTQLHFGFTIGN